MNKNVDPTQNMSARAPGLPPDLDREELTIGGYNYVDLSYPNGAHLMYRRGYDLYTASGDVFEPEVLFIEDVDVPAAEQHQGFGKRLVESAVQEARNAGFELGRAELINPYMIHILESLAADGQIQKIAYLIKEGEQLEPETATKHILEAADLATPAAARTFLDALEIKNNLNRRNGKDPSMGAVITAFKL